MEEEHDGGSSYLWQGNKYEFSFNEICDNISMQIDIVYILLLIMSIYNWGI